MPSRIATACAVVMALYCPVFAESHIRRGSLPVSFEAPTPVSTPQVATLGELAADAHTANARLVEDAREAHVVRFSFDITSNAKQTGEVVVPVRVMAGARVVGMRAVIDGVAMSATDMQSNFARARYEVVVERAKDPALLEHVATTDGHDELRLRVFPLSAGKRASVELAIEMPHERDWMTEDTVTRFVSPQTSLIALEPEPVGGVTVPSVTIYCGGYAHWRGEIDKTIIRRYMKRQLPRLKGCYDRALLANPQLAGRADLHFTIGSDGRTHDVSVDGELASDAARACIAEQLAGFEFPSVPEGGSSVQVHYPVNFVTYF